MNFYHEHLTDYYRNPRNQGTLERPDFMSNQFNPSCGDLVSMCGTCHEGILTSVRFQAKGCVISVATASMLAEFAQGKAVDTVRSWDAETVLELIKMPLGPTRLKCALLPLVALQAGVKELMDPERRSD